MNQIKVVSTFIEFINLAGSRDVECAVRVKHLVDSVMTLPTVLESTFLGCAGLRCSQPQMEAMTVWSYCD